MKKLALVLSIIMATFSAMAYNNSAVNYQSETECLGVGNDGTQTVRASGIGRNLIDAARQAEKNALHDVIFKGVRAGNGGCSSKPLVAEVNAEEKYQSYFYQFFADGGDYQKYVSQRKARVNSRGKSHNRIESKRTLTLYIKVADLKARLIQDGILKP